MEGAAGGEAKAEKVTGKKAQSGRLWQSSSSNRYLVLRVMFRFRYEHSHE
jgi:hypothetical protein